MRQINRPHLAICWIAFLGLLACSDSKPRRNQPLQHVEPPGSFAQYDPVAREQFEPRYQQLQMLLAQSEPDPRELGQAFGRLGMWFHTYLGEQSARKCYANAHSLDPFERRWPYYLGQLCFERGEYRQARAYFKTALRLKLDDVPILVRLGDLERADQRLDEAARYYHKALENQPNCVPALLGLGRLELEQRAWGRAARIFEKALLLQPKVSEAHYCLGLAYQALGQSDKAERHLSRAAVANKNRVRPAMQDPLNRERKQIFDGGKFHFDNGVAAMQQQRFQQAADHFEKAVAIYPERSLYRIHLGRAFLNLGRITQAADQFREVLALEPDNSFAHHHMGYGYQVLGDAASAERHYAAALNANPLDFEVIHRLCLLLLESARLEEGLPYLDHYLAENPNHLAARTFRSIVCLRAGLWVEVSQQIVRDTQKFPMHAQLRTLHARILAAAPESASRDGARALQLAQTSFEQEGSITAAETLAMAHAELGDFQEAIRWQAHVVAQLEAKSEPMRIARKRLRLYRRDSACKQPWDSDETYLSRPRIGPPPRP